MTKRRRKGPLAADPEMWEAFENGPGLRAVLEDFYTRVFADERLAPFFEHTNKEWVIDKQYSFLQAIFTGEKSYFGMRPRNAHHWMVISDELFDYREDLMESCLRRYGLGEHLIARLRALDEVYRKQIVKDAPIPLRLNGLDIPAEGYDTLELSIGAVCDGCRDVLDEGETVSYHLRTGQTYCAECRTPAAAMLAT